MKTIQILFAIVIALIAAQPVNAQKAKANVQANRPATAINTYTCPMHPDVTSDKPGKCSKCNMELKETGQTASSYSCPMHPDVTSDKQGKCTKCGMNLNLTPKEKMKMEVMKMYTCPMHPEITSNNPGKCSKCNMNLTKGKTKPGN